MWGCMHVSVVHSSLPLVLCKRFCQLRRQALQNCTQKKSELKKKNPSWLWQSDKNAETKTQSKLFVDEIFLIGWSGPLKSQPFEHIDEICRQSPSTAVSFFPVITFRCMCPVLHHYFLARGYNKLHCQRMSGLVTSWDSGVYTSTNL